MSTITTTDGADVSDEDFGEGISELSSRSANGLDVALLLVARSLAYPVVHISYEGANR